MVIQSNMTPEAIVEVWGVTIDIFKKYNIPLTKQSLETFVEYEQLTSLLRELNSAVGSSESTCIEGG
jgi:hypothetical protein